jgi:hypothetical protein
LPVTLTRRLKALPSISSKSKAASFAEREDNRGSA